MTKEGILSEGTKRNEGKSAQKLNIYAAKLVADAVRTTLGPKGMDKMVVDNSGNVIVTNDGVTILKELEIEHPTAKMIVEIAKTQEIEVGDGTTSAVILAGELLRKAEELIDEGIHPTIIAKGYRVASNKALELLQSRSKEIKITKDLLQKIGETAMTGKGAEDDKEHLTKILVDAIYKIKEHSKQITRNDIKIEKKAGGITKNTKIVSGLVLDKEKTHLSMPDEVKNAKIALIDSPIEIRTPETDSKISITSPSQIQEYLEMEELMLKEIVEKICESKANVVFCQKGIDDYAQHLLAKKGIYACRRVRRSDMEKISKATNAKILTDLEDLNENTLGIAGRVKQEKVGEDYMTYITDCQSPKVLTILVRGSTPHITDEIARAIDDALGDILTTIKSSKLAPGAGAVEIDLALKIEEYSNTLMGREQLAAKAFAKSLEIIPRTLAENAGLDTIDIIAILKSHHKKGNINSGINVHTGKIMNSWKEGIIEPLQVKITALQSASDVAIMILRIDDVILSEKKDINEDLS
ncbi:MAG: thermosome subunit alpha [Candidatus Woesearchaeota archaeon]